MASTCCMPETRRAMHSALCSTPPVAERWPNIDSADAYAAQLAHAQEQAGRGGKPSAARLA
jgi:hypothetical protein